MGFHKGMCGPDRAPGSVMDVTLADYVQRKSRQEAFNAVVAEAAPKKLTFDEWWKTQVFAGFKDDPVGYIRNVWKAAQENMP